MRAGLLRIVLVALAALNLQAQTVANDTVFAPLEHNGALTIWWVEPTTEAQRAQLGLEKIVPSVPRLALDQRTASELGQNASTFGQNAGSYGQTASSYGTNAGNTGQTAGSYGASASNVGRNASDTGQNASSYGQTAGSFGQTASTFGVAASDTDKLRKDIGPLVLTAQQQLFASSLRVSFPELNVRMVAVPDVQLKDKLTAAGIAGTYPDVVMADGALPNEWRSLAATAGVVTLGETAARLIQEFSDQPVRPLAPPVAAILLRAPHPEAARAFVTWLREGTNVLSVARLNDGSAEAAAVAIRAATAVLSGAGMPGADPAIAAFTPELARDAALGSSAAQAATAMPVRLEVLSIRVDDRLAIVKLRATLGSPVAFGLAYPLLVLRRVGGEGWKVLQIGVGLPPAQADHAEALLRRATRGRAAGPLAAASGLQPLDGDTRAPQPELGWEHGEGGGLFVVEWQQGFGGSAERWMPTNLFFVADDGMRSQTRVNAQFAEAGGPYRWRVWAVGAGGAVKLSAWQTFTVVGR